MSGSVRAGVRRAIDLGLLLFCAVLAATSRRTWERVLWAALAGAWLVQAVLAARNDATQGRRKARGLRREEK